MENENKEDLIKIIVSGLIYILAIFIKTQMVSKILFLISYFIVGFEVLKEAVENILKGKVFDENFLMAVATIRCINYFRVSRSCCCYVVLSNWRIISEFSYR